VEERDKERGRASSETRNFSMKKERGGGSARHPKNEGKDSDRRGKTRRERFLFRGKKSRDPSPIVLHIAGGRDFALEKVRGEKKFLEAKKVLSCLPEGGSSPSCQKRGQ